MSVQWIFDPAPPSGKRRGGNSAEYGFEGQIDTLVREVVQNSLDARISDAKPVDVVFRLVELDGDYFGAFMSAISWDSLIDNLLAVPDERGGHSIRAAVDLLEQNQSVRLLVVEDRGTKGLKGAEQRQSDTEKNSYCALVRDELYSDKDDPDAGGSFGLGKSLLWAYSSIKVVLFSSSPEGGKDGDAGLRFVGRTSLPYHETEEDGPVTGDGWLGVERNLETGWKRAESIWGESASQITTDCSCSRKDDDLGLSAVIVGLSEPGERDREPEEVADSIVEAGLESFWPAIVSDQLTITVQIERNEEVQRKSVVDPENTERYRPAVTLYKDFHAGNVEEQERLETAGGQAIRWVDIEIPERTGKDPHPAETGHVPVLVRLLNDDEGFDEIADRVFRFRRPGMVVRKSQQSNLSITARPYVAVVPAGLAGGDTETFRRIETFLRAAEPPEHNEWTHNTRSIKESYQTWGCRKKLQSFDYAVIEAIRSLIAKPEKKGGELPKAIMRHLRFGHSGGGGQQRFISITQERASPEDGSWKFSARCRRIRPEDKPWTILVKFHYAVDGGGSDDLHAIKEISAANASNISVVNGVGCLEIPADVNKVEFTGTTDSTKLPAIGTRSAVRLRVDGKSGVKNDA
ncbi:MAG: hypothetical protein K0U72_11825 [Gammaproteobacteria bacterium]|nr:hypothetical protein [Gammaproteobacteria bacterium]